MIARRFHVIHMLPLLALLSCRAIAGLPFVIKVIDAETGRGVPLVELRAVNSIQYWTDSNGIAAIEEPGFMNQEVFFHVHSHGYEYPKDRFNHRGVKLRVKAGGKAEIKINRLNIAERLYRITGEGIYRDSVLAGLRVPLKRSELNGQVMGQDTVIVTPYKGKLYWFWGDTDRASYPLGNFGASGATSEWPGWGGLDPAVGIDLTYFVDANGFSKPMCPDFGPGLQWIESLMTLKDETGRERLLARVTSAAGVGRANAWHVAMFNDEKQVFESLVRWELHDSHDVATPFRARVGNREYLYLYPNYRVRPDLHSLTNRAAYEAFTCLAPGTPFEGAASKIDRDGNGQVRYGWKTGAERLTGSRSRELVKTGLLQSGETWKQMRDIQTGDPVQAERGSVSWNEFRRRWVMIASGLPGEIWFAEGDTPVGPWVWSRRVVTHDDYNFYNPTHHRFFDQEGGRLIYFEGTYTAAFSGAKEKTPRYDYNQIMYRLALNDPRLNLPAPVYVFKRHDGISGWTMREGWNADGAGTNLQALLCFAIPPGRGVKGLVPVFQVTENGTSRLQTSAPASAAKASPLFYALPISGDVEGISSAATVPLYEYGQPGQWRYVTGVRPGDTPGRPPSEPFCRVWPNPMSTLIVDPVTPVNAAGQ